MRPIVFAVFGILLLNLVITGSHVVVRVGASVAIAIVAIVAATRAARGG